MKGILKYCLLLLVPLISTGQTQIGLKGGYNFFLFTQSNEGSYVSSYHYLNNSFEIGATVRQRITHTFNFGIELDYSHRAFGVKSSDFSPGGETTLDFHYSVGNLTLQFQPQLTFGRKFKVFFYPGIYFGALIQSTLLGTSSSSHGSDPAVTDTIRGSAKGNYPAFEFGLCSGLGIEFPIYKQLSFLAEYNFRMNILPIADSWGSQKDKMLNMILDVGIAYTIKSSKDR